MTENGYELGLGDQGLGSHHHSIALSGETLVWEETSLTRWVTLVTSIIDSGCFRTFDQGTVNTEGIEAIALVFDLIRVIEVEHLVS